MVDWLAIEGEYRAGQKSIRSIAREQGIDDGTIRARAKKSGWARNPAGTQREKVKAHFSGIPQPIPQCEARNPADALARAIADEELALGNAELVLRCIRAELEDAKQRFASADLKRLSEANAMNLATVRVILNLDDPKQSPIILEVPERSYEPTR